MLSLRMLFIAIEDWPNMEKIEDEIIEEISMDPFMKMLKIVEFSLFWDTLIKHFEHPRKSKWEEFLKNLEISD